MAPVSVITEATHPAVIMPMPSSSRVNGSAGAALPICMAPSVPARTTSVTIPQSVVVGVAGAVGSEDSVMAHQ